MTFFTILLGLLPSFLMVVLGGGLRKRLSENAWTGLDRLNYEILFPSLIFVSAAQRPISLSQLAAIAPLVWALLAVGLLCGSFSRRFGPDRFLDYAGCWQVAWRFNGAIGFVAIATLSQGDMAIFAVVIGMAVPVANVFAVSALSRGGELGLWSTTKRILFNPFLVASLAGVAVAVSGIKIPLPIMAPFELLAQAAIPIALISIGATMNWSALAKLDRFSGILNAAKLIVMPATVLVVGWAVNASGPLVQVLLVFAALPTASAAHILAAGFGANRALVATLVAQTTLLSALTLPIWIAVAEAVF